MSSNEIRIHKTLARCGILAVVLLATLCRCARQAAPQGGPRDSLPPKVVTMTPAFGTTHFKDKRILIEFDEYVQLEDQQKEFFTSPFMEQKPVLSIRGRSVQIDLKEDLDSNRTYALDFGSSVVDNNEGNPYVGLRYVFSTGGEIDSLLMSGYTVDAQKGDTLGKVFLLFFDAKADSIPAYDSTIVNSKPLSVARSYPNGIFIAENLKPMDYRIYALEDNNNNMRYEPGVDRVAFLDTVFNPLREPAFDIWYDTSRRYMQADPQLMMRLFKEIPSKRQTYTGASRPQSNRVTLMFSAPFPQIDTLVFEGFDPSKILTEYVTPRRDTMTLWFDAIEEEMPDTLRGRLVYRKHDSTGVLQSAGQDLAIAWRRPAKKEKEKANNNKPRAEAREEPSSLTVAEVFDEFSRGAPGGLYDALMDFDQHRQALAKKDKKKLWSPLVAKKICKSIKRLVDEAGVKDRAGYAIAMLNQSVENGWTGVFAIKDFVDKAPAAVHIAQPAPDKPRKITKDTTLADLLGGVGA